MEQTANPVTTAPQTTQAPETNETPNTPVTKEPEFILEGKVNGQVRRYTREEALARLQREDAATERFEKASQMTKQMQALIEKAKTDPIQALMSPELGLSQDQIRQVFEKWYSENIIEPETMTEAERIAKLNARELAQYKQKEQERLEEEKTLQQKQMDEQIATQVQQDLIQALQKSDLPKNRFTVARMAFFMKQNLAQGYDAPMEVIVQQVKDEAKGVLSDFFGTATPEQIVAIVPDIVKKLREYDIANLKKKFNLSDDEKPQPQSGKTDKRPMSEVDNYFNQLRRSRR